MPYSRFIYVICMCLVVWFGLSTVLKAQQNNSPSPNPPASPPSGNAQSPSGSGGGTPSSGTYSIEAEIFAYKSLQMNSRDIAADIATLIPASEKPDETAGVVIVPSVSTILPSFQLWRSNMLVIQNFLNQTSKIDSSKCTAKSPIEVRQGPSFAAYATGVTQAVGAIQSVLSLFASNQNITEFPGTIQDQALISAVARELRSRRVKVIAPDIFTPWMIDTPSAPEGSPFFIGKLTKLIDELSRLQDYYQCAQLALGFGSQLLQTEISRESDFAQLADPSVTDTAKRNALVADVEKLTAQIELLRQKIGLDMKDPRIANPEKDITTQLRVLTSNAGAQDKNAALAKIKDDDADIIGTFENPLIAAMNLSGAKAQTLVIGIEGYLAGLTGGAVSFTPPTPPSSQSPTTPTSPSQGAAQPPPPGGNQGNQNAAQQPPNGANNTGNANPSPTMTSTASSTPPIVTILQADGLARKMGVQSDAGDKWKWKFDVWRILWVKSMESGGAIVNESNILGSHPHFAGGAVSGFALFKLDGTLVCSGNAAAYGGYVKPKDFVKKNASVAPVRMLSLATGDCSPD
jgi:hypothetical protein